MKIILHLGMPRTATTTLQTSFFSKSPEINYLGKPFFNKQLQELRDAAKNQNKDKINELKKLDLNIFLNNKINVFSDESFLDPFDQTLAERTESLQSLKNFFGKDCEIFITLRSQKNLLRSYFNGPYRTFNENIKLNNLSFTKLVEDKIMKNKSVVDLLNYDLLIEELNEIFGKDKVHIFLYEEFAQNSYYEKLSKLFCIPTYKIINLLKGKHFNKGDAGLAAIFVRFQIRYKFLKKVPIIRKIIWFIDQLIRRSSIFHKIFSRSSSNFHLTKDAFEELNKLFSKSNKNLLVKHNIPINLYSYFK